MEGSCRQNQRIQPITPKAGTPVSGSSRGAVDSWDPAAPSSSWSWPLSVSVLLIDQIPTVKPLDQVCICCTRLSQAPVSSSTPVTIIIVPPMRITHT